jgi:hypothetical protein
MTDWQREIEIELRRAEGSTNPGRLRTAARRIAGIALQQLQQSLGQAPGEGGYMNALRKFMSSKNIPREAAAAAERLEARISPDFTSPSVDPVGDAMLIVEYVKTKLLEDGDGKNGHRVRD